MATLEFFKGSYKHLLATLKLFKGSYKHVRGTFKCRCKHLWGLRWPDLPFVRFLANQSSAAYISKQSNYCRGVWNFQCHTEHALAFLENLYRNYAKEGRHAGMEKLKRHRRSIKDLWNYIL